MSTKIDPEKILLQRVELLNENVNTTKEFWTNNEKPDILDFSFTRDFLFNLDEKLIVVELGVHYEGMKQKDKEEIPVGLTVEYAYQFYFNILNIEDFKVEDDEKALEGSIITTIMGIAFSTLRGIVHEKTRGTSIGVVLLPVVSPTRLLTGALSGKARRPEV